MGLFGRRKEPKLSPEFLERTFTMPCTRQEALNVIANATDHAGAAPFSRPITAFLDRSQAGDPNLGQPSLTDSIYLESLDDSGFVLAAGNRVNTYWKFQLRLDGEDPTTGIFEATLVNDSFKGYEDVLSMIWALRLAVDSVGGRRLEWPQLVG